LFNAFAAKFPKVKVNHTVDLSKYLDGRINQAFQRGELFADMAILQTLQDYDAWEEKGVLLNYKPPSFDKIWPSLTSANGAYLAVFTGMSFVVFFFPVPKTPRLTLGFKI
jgi:ABC-type Fe3+ transport system substrate-binding protein